MVRFGEFFFPQTKAARYQFSIQQYSWFSALIDASQTSDMTSYESSYYVRTCLFGNYIYKRIRSRKKTTLIRCTLNFRLCIRQRTIFRCRRIHRTIRLLLEPWINLIKRTSLIDMWNWRHRNITISHFKAIINNEQTKKESEEDSI